MFRFLACFFACQHAWGFPQRGTEHCTRCGAQRAARITWKPDPRLDVPRNCPKLVEAPVAPETGIEKERRALAELERMGKL